MKYTREKITALFSYAVSLLLVWEEVPYTIVETLGVVTQPVNCAGFLRVFPVPCVDAESLCLCCLVHPVIHC